MLAHPAAQTAAVLPLMPGELIQGELMSFEPAISAQSDRLLRLIAQAVGAPAELLNEPCPEDRPAPWGWGSLENVR